MGERARESEIEESLPGANLAAVQKAPFQWQPMFCVICVRFLWRSDSRSQGVTAVKPAVIVELVSPCSLVARSAQRGSLSPSLDLCRIVTVLRESALCVCELCLSAVSDDSLRFAISPVLSEVRIALPCICICVCFDSTLQSPPVTRQRHIPKTVYYRAIYNSVLFAVKLEGTAFSLSIHTISRGPVTIASVRVASSRENHPDPSIVVREALTYRDRSDNNHCCPHPSLIS